MTAQQKYLANEIVFLRRFILVLMIAVFSGCAATKQAPITKSSGFIEDYSILRDGKEGEAQRLYIKSNVKWARYDKILLDPVTLWRGYDSRFRGISHSDAQHLADYFYNLTYARLAQDYKMVRKPASQTLRVSIAITKIDEANVALDVISNVVPQMRLVSKLKEVVTGKPSFVGEVAIEMKVTDAKTGVLLGAAVDRRVGAKRLDQASLKSWGDIEQIIKFWVEKFSYRLCKGRGEKNCVLPQE